MRCTGAASAMACKPCAKAAAWPTSPSSNACDARGGTDMKLEKNMAAVVTGGASGLGAATARALAARGVRVAIFDLQRDKGEALAAEIGGLFCAVDVTSDDSVDAGFAAARAAHG